MCSKIINEDNFKQHMKKIHERDVANGSWVNIETNGEQIARIKVPEIAENSNVVTINLDGEIVASEDGVLSANFVDGGGEQVGGVGQVLEGAAGGEEDGGEQVGGVRQVLEGAAGGEEDGGEQVGGVRQVFGGAAGGDEDGGGLKKARQLYKNLIIAALTALTDFLESE
jgi:hypothetical protein